jgi:hypothetical protein
MIDSLFDSPFHWIALVGITSAVLVVGITAIAVARLSSTGIRRVATEEDGAAYTLSYVMVTPIYLLLICAAIESGLIMIAKLGTIYAAYAGARTAIVQYSSMRPDDAERLTIYATRKAFVPFANGLDTDMNYARASNEARQFIKAYESYSGVTSARINYLAAKYMDAQNLRVDTGGPPSHWHSDITVTVEYDYRFHVPGLSPIFGDPLTITSSATLQNEGPKNETQRLGIRYASPN